MNAVGSPPNQSPLPSDPLPAPPLPWWKAPAPHSCKLLFWGVILQVCWYTLVALMDRCH